MRIKRRSEVINFLISQNNYERYLEIGIRVPDNNFDKIKCSVKDGVDPLGRCNYMMTSDEFFGKIESSRIYDIIFIDGLHVYEQVFKDISNSLDHLAPDGVIVLHDCNPLTKKRQRELENRGKKWNGTAWKAFVRFRMSRSDLEMYVIDTDNGVGIVKRGKQKLLESVDDEKLTYGFLKRNRKKLLNLYSIKKFIKKEGKDEKAD